MQAEADECQRRNRIRQGMMNEAGHRMERAESERDALRQDAEYLRSENEQLREALDEIACRSQSLDLLWWQQRARAALERKEGET